MFTGTLYIQLLLVKLQQELQNNCTSETDLTGKNKRDVQRPVKPIRKLPPDSRPLLRSEGVLSEIDVST